MIYSLLYFFFVVAFINGVSTKKENTRFAAGMGIVLFLLVAFRSISVGHDTYGYVQFFLNASETGVGQREVEGLFLAWNRLWRMLHFNGQMYIIVCAIASVGLVLLSIWKSSKQRVWSYTLFLVAFSWYFYLSGIRQSIAMGCFTFGTFLLSKNINDLAVKKLGHLLKKENVLALSFLLSAPLFHTSALFADLVLMVALISPRRRRSFYLWAIIISFVICLTSVFKQAEQLLQSTVLYLDDDIEIMSRYENYSQDSFKYDSGFYLVLKSALPLNFMALLALYMCKRDYDIFERLYFWLVIVANLFFYFSYMFRLQMYFYPMACIAIANMLWPTLQKRRFDMVQTIVILFIVLISYTSYVNLVKDDGFVYHFFF